jgi:SnoaL-like domain
MELWEVVARESIRDLVTRYNSNGDSGRFAQVIELFAADAVMELQDRSYNGLDEIMTIFTGTQEKIRGTTTPSYVRHYTATHQIDLVDETYASGRCYFAVLSPTGLDHWGRYIDNYRVIDGAWRFASRRVIVDGQSPTSVL